MDVWNWNTWISFSPHLVGICGSVDRTRAEHFQFCSARRRYNYSDFLLHAYRIGPSAYKLRRHSRWLILIPPQWISSRRERERQSPASLFALTAMVLDSREKFMPRFPRLPRLHRWRCLVRTIGAKFLSPSRRSVEELDVRDTFDLTTIRVRIILLAAMHSRPVSIIHRAYHAYHQIFNRLRAKIARC